MEILNIEATKSTPCVVLDSKNHIHSFSGESYPENTSEFYSPIFEWLEEYLASLDSMATFNFEMVYFNSSTSKILMDIFDMFEESSEGG
jgi:hypothetical protein